MPRKRTIRQSAPIPTDKVATASEPVGPPDMRAPGPITWAALLLMILGSLTAFGPAIHYPFVDWDDPKYVSQNNDLGALSWEQVKVQSRSMVMGNYHPLTMLSYSCDILIAGAKNPHVMHATNLALHIINALLVFLFLWLLCGRPDVASMASLFFALHPARAETIGWISDRKDTMMLFFGMLMLCAYVIHQRRSHKAWLIASFGFFVCACLSKGMAVTLAPTLLLIDHYFGRSLREPKVRVEKAPFILAALVFGVVAVHAQIATATIEDAAPLGPVQRIITALASTTIYMLQSVIPLGLNARYDYPEMADGMPGLYLLAALATLIAGYAMYRWRRHRAYVFGLLFFGVNIFTVLQLFQVGTMVRADRYMYVAGIGLSFLLAWSVIQLMQGSRVQRILLLTLVFLYAGASVAWSRDRIRVWSAPMSVWADMIQGNPHNAIPHVSRAATYFTRAEFDSAVYEYNIALRLDPALIMVRYDRGTSLLSLGRYQEAMADFLPVFQAKVTSPPKLLQNMIYATMKLGRYQEAGANATSALKLDPKATFLYNVRAFCGSQLGQWAAAEADLRQALELDSTNSDTHYLMGKLLLAKGDTSRACALLKRHATEEIEDLEFAADRKLLLETLCR